MINIGIDIEIDPLRPGDSLEQLAALLSFLCGQQLNNKNLCPEANLAIQEFLNRIQKNNKEPINLSYEEFNELLLLFNQHRIERPFFNFFFLGKDSGVNQGGKGYIPFNELKLSIKKFRLFSMLCFGNFRFAFRKLSEEKNESQFNQLLFPWNRDCIKEKDEINKRQEPLTPLIGTEDKIAGNKTWFLGYISSDGLTGDSETLDKVISENSTPEDILKYEKYFQKLQALLGDMKDIRDKGKRNSIKYLTWDYLDIYVATSMRQPWEFSETNRFIEKLFTEELSDLPKIRWFDPTQSYYENVIDKGLLEGLMIKRAKCTIYMAQEGDTLGKDSELAATLAQGKPVIAYVPEIVNTELLAYAKELKERPPRYFRQRFLTLMADGFFDKQDNCQRVSELTQYLGIEITPDRLKNEIGKMIKPFEKFEDARLFQFVSDEESDFLAKYANEIEYVAKVFSAIESRAADNRADTIKKKHPLAIQVHLETGVANGVLVARSAKECARLVRGILTCDMKFDIRTITDSAKKAIATALYEQGTQSCFRVVTKDECLTNSFWNFYLDKKENN